MNLNSIQIGKFGVIFFPSIMQVKSKHWMLYLDVIYMNTELLQGDFLDSLIRVKEIYAIKVLCEKFLVSRISLKN